MEIHALLQAIHSPLPREDRHRLATHLEEQVRWLVQHDFERLVQVLYSLDIDESKLKMALKHQPDADTGTIIAAMIIERQLQKVFTRQHYHTDMGDDAERW